MRAAALVICFVACCATPGLHAQSTAFDIGACIGASKLHIGEGVKAGPAINVTAHLSYVYQHLIVGGGLGLGVFSDRYETSPLFNEPDRTTELVVELPAGAAIRVQSGREMFIFGADLAFLYAPGRKAAAVAVMPHAEMLFGSRGQAGKTGVFLKGMFVTSEAAPDFYFIGIGIKAYYADRWAIRRSAPVRSAD